MSIESMCLCDGVEHVAGSTCPRRLDLEPIEARLNAATPGPWRGHNFGFAGEEEPSSIVIHTGEFVWGEIYEGYFLFKTPDADSQNCNNAEFIAHAPTDIAALIDEVRRLRDELRHTRLDLAAALSGGVEDITAEQATGVVREVRHGRD